MCTKPWLRNSFDSYIIFRSSSPTSLASVGSASTTSYTDTNVGPNTTYYYSVVTFDTYGLRSAQSKVVSTATPQEPPPSTPTGLGVTSITGSQVNLSWSPSTGTPAIGGYIVLRGRSLDNLSSIGSTSSTTYSDNKVASNATYYYAVQAFDSYGLRSAQSNSTSVQTPR